ncbi:MAG: hypothetical protein J7513_14595, partial [Solirubrobacteraceae bacterium]|nr:hypothetical protein [Solirubrobacteraceae bacterium]
NLPGNSGQYTVEQLPANNKTSCSKTDPVGTVIDDDTATFRIRVTGRALSPQGTPIGPKRSIVATFKRKSFLDYIYFTDLEILDPTLYPALFATGATNTKENVGNNDIDATGPRNIETWGNQVCAQYAYVKAKNNKYRSQQYFNGSRTQSAGALIGGSWQSLSVSCSDLSTTNADIRFADADSVNGPLHTNDSPLICGSPNFGRDPTDAIETAAPGDSSITTVSSSWRNDPRSGCSPNTPDVNFNGSTAKSDKGSWLMNQGIIQLPPTNQSLDQEATAGYTFTGNTYITLNASTITVTGKRESDGANLNNATLAYPANGVIYVQNDSAVGCTGYNVSYPYAARPGCGIAWVSGNYATSLTIGAQDDIVVTNNIRNTATGTALLGLVATNFIRVQHKVVDQNQCADDQSGGTNLASGSITNARIDAALLTLKHSFIVDNFRCGGGLGDLTVYGAISQKFRGPVGTGSGRTNTSGYIKNYSYDNRLRTLSPPKFLDPVKAAWRLKTYQEQSPAT